MPLMILNFQFNNLHLLMTVVITIMITRFVYIFQMFVYIFQIFVYIFQIFIYIFKCLFTFSNVCLHFPNVCLLFFRPIRHDIPLAPQDAINDFEFPIQQSPLADDSSNYNYDYQVCLHFSNVCLPFIIFCLHFSNST